LDEGSGQTTTDAIGSADGTITGATWADGSWIGDYGLEGDGSSHVETSTLGSFGSSMDTDFAVAMTIKMHDQNAILGYEKSSSTRLEFRTDTASDLTGDGFGVLVRDGTNDDGEIQSSSDITDGTPHRCLFNKKTNTVSNWELWIDGNQDNATIHRNAWIGADMEDFADPLPLLASFHTGSLDGRLNVVVDDIIIFDDPLLTSQIQNDYDRQHWI
jgi:hypothetical protein